MSKGSIRNLGNLLDELTEIITHKGPLSCDQVNRLNGILEILENSGLWYDDSLAIVKALNELNMSHLPETLQKRIDTLLNKRAASAGRIAFGEMLG